jgi:hypothetical protein
MKQQSEHLTGDAELTALLETLDALERQATPGPWSVRLDTVLTKQGGGEGEPMQDISAGGLNVARFTVYSHLADGDLTVALRNAYPLLRERLSAALLNNQRVRKETIEECLRAAHVERLRLGALYKERLDGPWQPGNMDWGRLEGSVSTIAAIDAIRSLPDAPATTKEQK